MATTPTLAVRTWHQTEFCIYTCVSQVFSQRKENGEQIGSFAVIANGIIERRVAAWVDAKMTGIFGRTTTVVTNDYYIFIARY